MSKGIIVAGFGAIGKTTLGNKYDNIVDMESGYYQWDNTGFENIPYEQRKGKKDPCTFICLIFLKKTTSNITWLIPL